MIPFWKKINDVVGMRKQFEFFAWNNRTEQARARLHVFYEDFGRECPNRSKPKLSVPHITQIIKSALFHFFSKSRYSLSLFSLTLPVL